MRDLILGALITLTVLLIIGTIIVAIWGPFGGTPHQLPDF